MIRFCPSFHVEFVYGHEEGLPTGIVVQLDSPDGGNLDDKAVV